MESVHQQTQSLTSSTFPSFTSHPTTATSSSYPMYHNAAATPTSNSNITTNVTFLQQQSPRMQHAPPLFHSHAHSHPIHTTASQGHYSPNFSAGNPHAVPMNHFSLDETGNSATITSSIPNSPQMRAAQLSNVPIRSPKFKQQSSPLLSPSSQPSEDKGDERQRCCVVCYRNSPKSIFSCRYKVHDKNIDVLTRYFERELKFGELCDRCYRLWYKFKRNANGSTSSTPNFSPMIPPNGTPPFSPLQSPVSPKNMRQISSQMATPLSPLVLQQQQPTSYNGANNIGNSPLSLVPNSPASSSSKPYPSHMMPPPFSLSELSRDEKEMVHQVVNQHYQHSPPNKKYFMDGMEHDFSSSRPFQQVDKVASSPESDTVESKMADVQQQQQHNSDDEVVATSASSQEEVESEQSNRSTPSRSPSPKPKSFMTQLLELSKPPRISKRKPTAIRSVAKVDPVTEFVRFGHYTSTNNSSSIPLQTLYKNVVKSLNV